LLIIDLRQRTIKLFFLSQEFILHEKPPHSADIISRYYKQITTNANGKLNFIIRFQGVLYGKLKDSSKLFGLKYCFLRFKGMKLILQPWISYPALGLV